MVNCSDDVSVNESKITMLKFYPPLSILFIFTGNQSDMANCSDDVSVNEFKLTIFYPPSPLFLFTGNESRSKK